MAGPGLDWGQMQRVLLDSSPEMAEEPSRRLDPTGTETRCRDSYKFQIQEQDQDAAGTAGPGLDQDKMQRMLLDSSPEMADDNVDVIRAYEPGWSPCSTVWM